jgi:hypothetical protein
MREKISHDLTTVTHGWLIEAKKYMWHCNKLGTYVGSLFARLILEQESVDLSWFDLKNKYFIRNCFKP